MIILICVAIFYVLYPEDDGQKKIELGNGSEWNNILANSFLVEGKQSGQRNELHAK